MKLDSVSHSLLRAISATACTAAQAQRAIRADGHDETHADVQRALHRLGALQLASVDDTFHWSATAYGMATSQNLGPANVPRTYTAAPLTQHEILAQQTPSLPRSSLGTGDLRPPVMRPGSEVALQLPSRNGSERRWPDGRRDVV